MKKTILAMIAAALVAGTLAAADKAPVFAGNMTSWIGSFMVYPPGMADRHWKGVLRASFVVEPDGSVSDIRMIGDAEPMLAAELKRTLMSLPAWAPGQADGRSVAMRLYIAVDFNIEKRPIFLPYLLSLPDGSPMLVKDDVLTAPVDEEAARFDGRDLREFVSWVSQNIKSPARQDDGPYGTMRVIFTVDERGRVTDVTFEDSIGPAYDKAIMRTMMVAPRWTPRTVKGVPLSSRQSFRFTFN